ncbi:MAG: hypothetical protein EXR94_10365 [Gemmatimonadetes bacterium]|nr:hypothetical protein [Gemmatimonadota bacterium]
MAAGGYLGTMRNSIIGSILLSVAGSVGGLLAQDSVVGVSRIVAVGDVHGDFAQFTTVLRQAGVIDAKNRWAGGQTHLVQTGDVPDRGPDSRQVMDLLMELTPQAEKAGGQVHALIGNHEAMRVLGDLRYVSPGEYEAFRTSAWVGRAPAGVREQGSLRRLDPPEQRRGHERRVPLPPRWHRTELRGDDPSRHQQRREARARGRNGSGHGRRR